VLAWAEQLEQAQAALVVQEHPQAAAQPAVAQVVQAHPATVAQLVQRRGQVGFKEDKRARSKLPRATIPGAVRGAE